MGLKGLYTGKLSQFFQQQGHQTGNEVGERGTRAYISGRLQDLVVEGLVMCNLSWSLPAAAKMRGRQRNEMSRLEAHD